MKYFLENENQPKVIKLIAICKSDSKVFGKKLRDAHYQLGEMLAQSISNNMVSDHLTVIILFRAGLCFAEGIIDKLEVMGKDVSVLFHCNHESSLSEVVYNPKFIKDREILLVDAVINSGDSILRLAKNIKEAKQIMLAANVIQEESIHKFDVYDLFAVRASKNKFVGAKTDVVKDGKGPDTGDRLFNTK